MSKLIQEFTQLRKSMGMTQATSAKAAGLNRKTIQKMESAALDPRLSTLEVLARALGMEIMLVPAQLRPSLENFVLSGGKYLGQPPGVDAPLSSVDELLKSSQKSRPAT